LYFNKKKNNKLFINQQLLFEKSLQGSWDAARCWWQLKQTEINESTNTICQQLGRAAHGSCRDFSKRHLVNN